MKRRTALRLAVASLAGLAGCVSDGDGTAPGGVDTATPAASPTAAPAESPAASPTETPTPTERPTRTSTGPPTEETPRVVARSFRVTGRKCGAGESGAHTTIDAPRVVVEGTVVGSSGCATARLGEVTYDPGSDALNVVVEVYRPADAAACTQCLTDVDYRLRVRFEGGTPGRVRVAHEDAVVEGSDAG